jgi:tetratricopeptide (TPR) repeat protein
VPFHCIVGGTVQERWAADRALLPISGMHVIPAAVTAAWPFKRHVTPDPELYTSRPILIESLDNAFLIGQTAGTRLVLTQSTYQLQRWLDWLAVRPNITIVAHASREHLLKGAPEYIARRGPWHAISVIELDGDEVAPSRIDLQFEELHGVFDATPLERRRILTEAGHGLHRTNAAVHLALASTCMELDELPSAQDALDRATTLAPDWEAVWFEYGKLWLRADDLERAAERFAEAARVMPTFSAALSNLGAALAETDRPDEAIAALEQALRSDPEGYPILNNLAVVYREQGRLDEAIDAGRRVVALAPSFVFGSYNLAHALFLSGRFGEARDAYEDAQQRDPQKNPVQAARLAVVRAASGDGARAASDMRDVLERVPADMRTRITEEAAATLDALATVPQIRPADLDALRAVIESPEK